MHCTARCRFGVSVQMHFVRKGNFDVSAHCIVAFSDVRSQYRLYVCCALGILSFIDLQGRTIAFGFFNNVEPRLILFGVFNQFRCLCSVLRQAGHRVVQPNSAIFLLGVLRICGKLLPGGNSLQQFWVHCAGIFHPDRRRQFLLIQLISQLQVKTVYSRLLWRRCAIEYRLAPRAAQSQIDTEVHHLVSGRMDRGLYSVSYPDCYELIQISRQTG